MSDLDPFDSELRALLETERDAPGPSAARKAAIRAEVDAALSVPGSGAPPKTRPNAASPWGSLAARALLVAAGAAGGALLHAAFSPAPPASKAPIESVTTAPSAPPAAPVESVAPLPVAAPSVALPLPSARLAPLPPSAGRASAAPSTSASPLPASPSAASANGASVDWEAPRGSSTLAEERAIVERGRAALARRDGVSALEALRDHARKFPSGGLSEERDALEIQALASLGRADEARRRADAFAAKYPGSLFASRIEETLRQLR